MSNIVIYLVSIFIILNSYFAKSLGKIVKSYLTADDAEEISGFVFNSEKIINVLVFQ